MATKDCLQRDNRIQETIAEKDNNINKSEGMHVAMNIAHYVPGN